MKRLILFSIFLLFSILVKAQAPVFDGATNANLKAINVKLATIGKGISQTNIKLESIIKLLQEQNRILANSRDIQNRSRDIQEEELIAKKTAPTYVLNSAEVERALTLKNEILTLFNSVRGSVQDLEYLKEPEIDTFLEKIGGLVTKATRLYVESNKILTTTSIINPEERLSKIKEINEQLKSIVTAIKRERISINSINQGRGSRNSIINMNKKETN